MSIRSATLIVSAFLIVLTFGVLAPTALAQLPTGTAAVEITGLVVDESTGSPLAGAVITIEGTSSRTLTNRDGQFSLSYSAGRDFTLVISNIGYKTHRQNFSSSAEMKNLEFALTPDHFELDEIVVTGIASARARSVAEVSVARVDAGDLLSKQIYTNLDQLVSGKIPGVQMHPAAGYVGGGYRFFVRGGGGLNGTGQPQDRKSTRLNSSHVAISYAVFCLNKKTEMGISARGQVTFNECDVNIYI